MVCKVTGFPAQRQLSNHRLGKRVGAGMHHNGRNGEKWEVGREEEGGLEGAGTRKGNPFSDQPSFTLLSAADRLSTAHRVPRFLGIWFGTSSLAPGSLGQHSLSHFTCGSNINFHKASEQKVRRHDLLWESWCSEGSP